jgi:SAM-dependent methyltransferase
MNETSSRRSAPDWSRIDTDPVSRRVRAYLRSELRSRSGLVVDLDAYLERFTRGHVVLDIGAADHDETHAEAVDWKHAKIVSWAARAVGVDVLPEQVTRLRNRGFDIRLVDATSDVDLGERFDRIFAGDVIEHVNDPVGLLRFAGRHLKPGGEILVKTPNPQFLAYIWRSLRDGTFIANAEHTCWIGPSMALELGRRSGLSLERYFRLRSRRPTAVSALIYRVCDAMLGDNELLNASFLYVFR